MKTVIVRSCLETFSHRVIRNAQTLACGGHAVTLLVWDREQKYPKTERRKDYKIRRFNFKAPYGPKVLLFLPLWWCFEFWWLLKANWDVVHAIEFDTIFPAVIAGKIKRKPVIYELNDIYEDMIPLPQMLRKICLYIDRTFTRVVNTVIIADEATIKELKGIPNSNVVVIYNSLPESFKKFNISTRREDIFTIFYAGALYKSRRLNVDKLINAIRDIDDICLIIAGYGDQAEKIVGWAKDAIGKVQFIGKISYTEVRERTMNADLLILLHDPTIPINRISTSNKLFEAMMYGKSIIMSKGIASADLAERENFGLVIDCNSVEEIKKAIITLKDDAELRRQLGANGRRAYVEKYSWEIMQRHLLALYKGIGEEGAIQ